MVRIGLLLLCLALLLPISGAEAAGQYVAFVFEMGDSPAADLGFSQMLQHRNAKITLLLENAKEVQMEGNFEAALLFPKEWNSLTRLQVAQQLKNRQDQLPAGQKCAGYPPGVLTATAFARWRGPWAIVSWALPKWEGTARMPGL